MSTTLPAITTHGIKYIGSKKTINPYIIDLINKNCGNVKTAIDVFTGTTRVAQAFRQQGWYVTTSDMNWASEAYSNAFICNHNNLHLQPYIDQLNSVKPIKGWLTETYCDTLGEDKITKVKVWQIENGMKADAIRDKIETFTDLEIWEKMTLITSLIMALDRVDNTVGVQQAYLKEWCTRSHLKLKLSLPPMIWDKKTQKSITLNAILNSVANRQSSWNPIFTTNNSNIIEPIFDNVPEIILNKFNSNKIIKDDEFINNIRIIRGQHINGDALINDYPESDVAYLDPPYSSHSYATYYHIWDSIVAWDKPDVALNTNRRKDRTGKANIMKSAWNSKTTALNAFKDLIQRLPVKYVIISYNDESLVSRKDLIDVCNKEDINGKAIYTEFDYKRNIMSSIGNAQLYNTTYKTENKEILILIRK